MRFSAPTHLMNENLGLEKGHRGTNVDLDEYKNIITGCMLRELICNFQGG